MTSRLPPIPTVFKVESYELKEFKDVSFPDFESLKVFMTEKGYECMRYKDIEEDVRCCFMNSSDPVNTKITDSYRSYASEFDLPGYVFFCHGRSGTEIFKYLDDVVRDKYTLSSFNCNLTLHDFCDIQKTPGLKHGKSFTLPHEDIFVVISYVREDSL